MKFLKRLRPSPAMAVAGTALFISLAGTSVAAYYTVPRNSVGTLEVRNNSLTSADVKNRSLGAVDFRSLPRGPAGPQGPAGPAGPAGAAGPAGTSAAAAYGVIADDGALIRQKGVSTTSHTGTGRYTVGFGTTNISNCAWLATPGELNTTTVLSDAEITVTKDTDTTVRVATAVNDTAADVDFVIAIFC